MWPQLIKRFFSTQYDIGICRKQIGYIGTNTILVPSSLPLVPVLVLFQWYGWFVPIHLHVQCLLLIYIVSFIPCFIYMKDYFIYPGPFVIHVNFRFCF